MLKYATMLPGIDRNLILHHSKTETINIKNLTADNALEIKFTLEVIFMQYFFYFFRFLKNQNLEIL